jgi:hypothetical protein
MDARALRRPLGVDRQVCRGHESAGPTRKDFNALFETAKYRQKESIKHQKFSRRFIEDPDSIDW